MDDMINPAAIADWLRDEASDSPDPRYANWALSAADTIEHMAKELRAAKGYMLNALFDLQSTTPKATAIRTVNGGIARIDETIREWE